MNFEMNPYGVYNNIGHGPVQVTRDGEVVFETGDTRKAIAFAQGAGFGERRAQREAQRTIEELREALTAIERTARLGIESISARQHCRTIADRAASALTTEQGP